MIIQVRNELLKGWKITLAILACSVLYLVYRDFGDLRGIILSPWIEYQETTGVISSSTVLSGSVGMGRTEDFAEIIYEFSVGEKDYQADQINYASDMYRVEHYLDKYPVGERVVVYYDLDNPNIAG